eukprot:TRINITY_DN50960_c0_g1_i1.p1 TRINITY_DN50960_c0_g1~~TRINITY_DN50960_c0_g1_i1.p1  ORF type:complete len:395 (+),score=15.05 TRINITY_DN50960_c0_g1_i1:66-1250(+)
MASKVSVDALECDGIDARQTLVAELPQRQRSSVWAGHLMAVVHEPSTFAARMMALAFVLENVMFMFDAMHLGYEYLLDRSDGLQACSDWRKHGSEYCCEMVRDADVVYGRWMVEQALFIVGDSFSIACAIIWYRSSKSTPSKHGRVLLGLSISIIVVGAIATYTACSQEKAFLQCRGKSYLSYSDIVESRIPNMCPGVDSSPPRLQTPRAYGHWDGLLGVILLVLTVGHDAFEVTLYSWFFMLVAQATEVAERFSAKCEQPTDLPGLSFWQDIVKTHEHVRNEVIDLSTKYSKGMLCAVACQVTYTLATYCKVALSTEDRPSQRSWVIYQVFRALVSSFLLTGLCWRMLRITLLERTGLLALSDRLSDEAASYSSDEYSTIVQAYSPWECCRRD